MTLSQDILAAADTIDQLNKHMEFGDKSTWNASELRHVARAVEEEEQEAAQRKVTVAQLTMDIFNQCLLNGIDSQTLARSLIELGWRKVEPE